MFRWHERSFECDESLTADFADIMPICTPSAEETLGMWLKDMAEMFEGGLQSKKDMEAEGGVSDTTHNLCLFILVDHASSHMLVLVHIRSQHLYTSSVLCLCCTFSVSWLKDRLEKQARLYTRMYAS